MPDSAFTTVADSALIFAVAKDESLFVGVPAPRHYLSSGDADTTYNAAAIPPQDVTIARALAVNAASEAVVFGNNIHLTKLRAAKLTGAGALSSDFGFAASMHPSGTSTTAFFIEPLADGSFVAATGETQLGALSVVRVLPTGALDPAFAGGSIFGDAVVGAPGIPFIFDFLATSDAFYVIGQSAHPPTYARHHTSGREALQPPAPGT